MCPGDAHRLAQGFVQHCAEHVIYVQSTIRRGIIEMRGGVVCKSTCKSSPRRSWLGAM